MKNPGRPRAEGGRRAGALAYLLHDPVDLAVLGVDLVAHVQGHVTQVADDPAHLLQVLVHLVFPGVVCYPAGRRTRLLASHVDPELRSPRRRSDLRMKPPLMAICSRSSTTRAGWLATTPSWLFPQALLAPLFILATAEEEEALASGPGSRFLLNLNPADHPPPPTPGRTFRIRQTTHAAENVSVSPPHRREQKHGADLSAPPQSHTERSV